MGLKRMDIRDLLNPSELNLTLEQDTAYRTRSFGEPLTPGTANSSDWLLSTPTQTPPRPSVSELPYVRSRLPFKIHNDAEGDNDDGDAYQCNRCSRSFQHKCSLVRHVRSIHLHERSYSCDLCNRIFGRRDNLRTHILFVHDRRNTVACPTCGKLLACERSLRHHLKQLHSDSSPMTHGYTFDPHGTPTTPVRGKPDSAGSRLRTLLLRDSRSASSEENQP